MKIISLITLSTFLHMVSCVQTDNSHSSDKTRNTSIKQLNEINELQEKSDSGDTSVELTVSQKAFLVLSNNCTGCHYHSSWEINDDFWLNDSVFSLYIEPDSSNNSRIIDRLSNWGTGVYGAANMPQNGTLSEEDYTKLNNWVKYLIEQKDL